MTALVAKGEKDSVTSKAVISEKVPLPLKEGQEIGELVLYQNEEEIGRYPLVAAEDVEKATFRELLHRLITYGR